MDGSQQGSGENCESRETNDQKGMNVIDRRTDGRTDTPSYRDGWTHLKNPFDDEDFMLKMLMANFFI